MPYPPPGSPAGALRRRQAATALWLDVEVVAAVVVAVALRSDLRARHAPSSGSSSSSSRSSSSSSSSSPVGSPSWRDARLFTIHVPPTHPPTHAPAGLEGPPAQPPSATLASPAVRPVPPTPYTTSTLQYWLLNSSLLMTDYSLLPTA